MAGMLRTNMFSHRMASQRWAAFDHILERGEWPSRRTNGEQGLGIRAKHRFAATGKRRQSPAEEETGSWDPYHYPWSGVVAKTPPPRGHSTAGGRGDDQPPAGEECRWDWMELRDTPWGCRVFVLVGAVPFRAVPGVGEFTPGRDQRPAS